MFTFPPKPMGRGRKLRPSPVRETAESLGIPVLEREALDPGELGELKEQHQASLILVTDYGRLVGVELLNVFPGMWLNLHPSLLPRWRGPAPIRRSLMVGDLETGVTLMVMNERLDEGYVLGQARVQVHLDDDFDSLSERLAEAGTREFLDAAPRYLKGDLVPTPQTGEPTYAPAIGKEESQLQWGEDALSLHYRVRALNPGPGTFTFFRGKRLKIIKTLPHPKGGDDVPGTVRVEGNRLFVSTGRGELEILCLQPEGKRPMTSGEFLRGYHPRNGERLGR